MKPYNTGNLGDNYKIVGMKPKNGKMVPNCVYNKKCGKYGKKLSKKQKGGNKKLTKRRY